MSLESRLKSAVNALEKPFKGIIPENLMPEHSKWEPEPTPEPGPEPGPEPSLPDQDPLPQDADVSTGGRFYVSGMVGASVSFKKDGEVVMSGTIGEEGYFSQADVEKSYPAGTEILVEVTMTGYKDWSNTIAVKGGK